VDVFENPETRKFIQQFTVEDHRKRLAANGREDMVFPSAHVSEALEINNRSEEEQGISVPWAPDVKLKPNTMTVVGGANGHKKSMMTSQLALQVAKTGKAAIMQLEEGMGEQVLNLTKQAFAKQKVTDDDIARFAEWAEDRVYLYSRRELTTVEPALGFLWAAADWGANLGIVDNLQKLGMKHNDNDQQNRDVELLLDVANNNPSGMHVLIVHHITKPQFSGEDWRPDRYSLRGSGGLSDKPHNVFLCYHNKKRAAAARKASDERDVQERQMLSTQAGFELDMAKLRGQEGERVLELYDGAGPTIQRRAGDGAIKVFD
jgi:twinkle protein